MAFNTYSDLKLSIISWVENDSVTTSHLNNFITLAEERLARDIRIRQTETALSVTLSSGVATIPSDFIELKYAYIDGDPIYYLEPKEPTWLLRKYPIRTSQGKPLYIAVDGSSFIFGPYPDSDYGLAGTYYKKPTALSDTNETNEWTDNVPELLFWACMLETAPFLYQDERFDTWDRRYREAYQRIKLSERKQARRQTRVSTS